MSSLPAESLEDFARLHADEENKTGASTRGNVKVCAGWFPATAVAGKNQRPAANVTRTRTSGCSEALKLSAFSRSSRAIVVFSHREKAASSSSCVPER